MSPSQDEIVLVAVNEGSEGMEAELSGFSSLQAFSGKTGMTGWETSASRSLEKVSEGSPDRYAFPARSITTLVIR